VLTRLARWWLARKVRKAGVEITVVDECEVCGEPAVHRIVSGSQDDAALGITEGGTLMAADFCAEHCPGGCLRGCEGVRLDG
jgi:hypothetical protein